MVDAKGARSVLRAVLLAVIVLVVFVAVERSREASALEAARERTAAMGLRLDAEALGFVQRPEVVRFFARLEALLKELDDDGNERMEHLEAQGMDFEAAWKRSDRDAAAKRADDLLALAAELVALDVRLPQVGRVEHLQVQADDARQVLVFSKYLKDASLAPMQAGSIDLRCWNAAIRSIHVLESCSYDAWGLWIGQLLLLLAACDEIEETAGVAAADEARAALREGLGAYDLAESCRAALRRGARASLDSYAETFGVVHELRLLPRITGGRDRDLAELHRSWADLVEANDLSTPAARDQRLAELAEQVRELDVERYPLTRLLVPGLSWAWEGVDEVTRALR